MAEQTQQPSRSRPPMPPISLSQVNQTSQETPPSFLAQQTAQSFVPRSARYHQQSSDEQTQIRQATRQSAQARGSSQPRVFIPSQVAQSMPEPQNQSARTPRVDPTQKIAQSLASVQDETDNPVMAQIRLKTLLLEYQLLQKYAPVGVFLMPADPLPNDPGPKLTYWKGMYFCKQGIYQDAVLKFRMTFLPDYPRSMPKVHFQTNVFHPLVDSHSGELKLERDFGDWQFSKNWLIQVLLFIKKIFHLEKYYNLDGQRTQALNLNAFDLYHKNFETFVDRCIECVQASIDNQYAEEVTQVRLSKPNATTDTIKAKIESFQDEGNDLRAKEQLKNYFKQNLPNQLVAAEREGAAQLQQAALPQMSIMTAIQSRVMRE